MNRGSHKINIKMMKKKIYLFGKMLFLLPALCFFTACEDDGSEVVKPDYELEVKFNLPDACDSKSIRDLQLVVMS